MNRDARTDTRAVFLSFEFVCPVSVSFFFAVSLSLSVFLSVSPRRSPSISPPLCFYTSSCPLALPPVLSLLIPTFRPCRRLSPDQRDLIEAFATLETTRKGTINLREDLQEIIRRHPESAEGHSSSSHSSSHQKVPAAAVRVRARAGFVG